MVAINEAVREPDEWFEEPDDIERLQNALASIENISDPVEAAAVLAFRITRSQAFGEGNKRTALVVARWILDHNGRDGSLVLPTEDRQVADLLVRAAAGANVEVELLHILRARISP